jgi:hypothetical protein
MGCHNQPPRVSGGAGCRLWLLAAAALLSSAAAQGTLLSTYPCAASSPLQVWKRGTVDNEILLTSSGACVDVAVSEYCPHRSLAAVSGWRVALRR